MVNRMKIERNQLLSVLSEALDCVEKEVLGVADHHAKRVAYLCLKMGEHMGMSEEELSDLAVGALMHDNALNQYRNNYEKGAVKPGASGRDHCIAGEENLQLIPGCKAMRGFVLYHHENADGSGPFGKKEAEIPLGAQLVQIANVVDSKFSLGKADRIIFEDIRNYISENENRLFGKQVSECFLDIFTRECFAELSDENIEQLKLEVPPVWITLTKEGIDGIYSLADLFARIIDYKSPFTKNHSEGIAKKAEKMARYYQYDEETTAKLYLAGALHDIGKLLVDRDILEKPGRLEEQEYKHIQTHAYETFRLLSKVTGLKEVTEWASYHHEKLNGTGYPFGKKAEELNKQERLLACLDIYQALTEERPYKAGMTHAKAVSILKEMAGKQELDDAIVSDIEQVFSGGQQTGEQEQEKTALFQCRVCGYIYEGDTIPDGFCCPVCGQPETVFLRVL